jgi:hypothetical protein
VNYTYDPASRIFRVDDVATEYALVQTNGRNESRMRVQRQIAGNAAVSGLPKGKR